MSLHPKELIKLFFFLFTLTSSMHQKFTEHGTFCIQNNQLPTKSPVELKDNSIDRLIYNVIFLCTGIVMAINDDVCSIPLQHISEKIRTKNLMHSSSLPNTHDRFEVVFHGAPDVRVKIKFVAQLVGLSPTTCRFVRKNKYN